ncbi:hypothetical protein ACS5PM_20120 [Ideonella sp. YS5]
MRTKFIERRWPSINDEHRGVVNLKAAAPLPIAGASVARDVMAEVVKLFHRDQVSLASSC